MTYISIVALIEAFNSLLLSNFHELPTSGIVVVVQLGGRAEVNPNIGTTLIRCENSHLRRDSKCF
jgi:hypothetical protein